MHNISNSFYFGSALYRFRTVFPSIIRSLRLYIQYQEYVIQVQRNACLALYMFRTVFPSIIRSLKLYTQHQAYFIQVQRNAC